MPHNLVVLTTKIYDFNLVYFFWDTRYKVPDTMDMKNISMKSLLSHIETKSIN